MGAVPAPTACRAQQTRGHKSAAEMAGKPTVRITYERGDDIRTIDAPIGENLLEIAHANKIDLEGACECSVACSTCHVILDYDVFDELPEPCEDEDDMLDQAPGLTETSRLGCQVVVTEAFDGTVVELPMFTRNFYVDGHVPEPH